MTITAAERAPEDVVYFVTGDADGFPVKVGRSKVWSLASRLHNIRTHVPYRLRVLVLMCAWPGFEQELHALFSETRLRGEWFERTPDILAMVDDLRKIKPNWRECYADYLDPDGFVPDRDFRHLRTAQP